MIAYLDTSALVKVILKSEEGHQLALQVWDRATALLTNRIAYPEARAALAAARRLRRATPHESAAARSQLEARWREIDIIELRARLARSAGNAAERYGLRGYDAVHLASAMAVAGRALVVLTWDRELAAAAYEAGLSVAP